MGEELQKPTLFWAAKGSTDFKPLTVEHIDGIESIDDLHVAEYKPMEYSMSFDMELSKEQTKNLRRLFKTRIPRKLKKKYKMVYAKYFGVKTSRVILKDVDGFIHEIKNAMA